MYTYIFFLVVGDNLLQKHISEPQRWPNCELKIMSTAFEKIKIVGVLGILFRLGDLKHFNFIFISSSYPTSSQFLSENQKMGGLPLLRQGEHLSPT